MTRKRCVVELPSETGYPAWRAVCAAINSEICCKKFTLEDAFIRAMNYF